MAITDIEVMQHYIRMCGDGWDQGWHERNGGNLTYRMRPEEVEQCRPYFNDTPGQWVNMGVQADNLRGEFFISTGSGKYIRNVGGRPTSEFPSHFLNHSVRKEATGGVCRVIYHAHPANLIAMTYILPLTARDFTRALWKSATECPVVFPGGVGVVPWMVPGGSDIALATSQLMKEYDAAVWAHHGLFASGPDFDTTFGLMHTIEKAAQIYILALSAGQGRILQTIEDDDLRAIAKDFGVTLREEFLD